MNQYLVKLTKLESNYKFYGIIQYEINSIQFQSVFILKLLFLHHDKLFSILSSRIMEIVQQAQDIVQQGQDVVQQAQDVVQQAQDVAQPNQNQTTPVKDVEIEIQEMRQNEQNNMEQEQTEFVQVKMNQHQVQDVQKMHEILLMPTQATLQKIQCSEGKYGKNVCSDQKCHSYGILCQDYENCKCFFKHKYCIVVNLKSILNSLLSRKKAFQPIKSSLDLFIDKTIDQLSQYRKKLSDKMKNKYEQICLNQKQKQFISVINSGQVQKICGRNTWHILALTQFLQKIQDITKKTKRDMQITWNILEKQLNVFKDNFEQKLNRCTLIQQSYFYKSEIITTYDQTKNIRSFFQKPIKCATLMYRASQNEFQVEKFFEKCSYMRNTITFVVTQFEKIIGGFNPHVWIKSDKDQFFSDQQEKSFIFSLTNNQKLALLKKANAIRRNVQYGPMWGDSSDLAIYNKANQNNTSHSNICSAYASQSYKQAENILYQKFTGTKAGNGSFKIKQWEVWELKFDE